MTLLASKDCTQKQKLALEKEVCNALKPDEAQSLLIRENLGSLWDIFVDTNVKSIAYFSVRAATSKEVNEIFRRLNTGGVSLTQLELVLSTIKADISDYEERLWMLSDRIRKVSGGINFSSSDILQFFHLLIKGTTRIDSDRIRSNDVALFQEELDKNAEPLVELFQGYLLGLLNINHASIVPRWLAVLPIAAYLTARKKGNHAWRIHKLSNDEVNTIHRYFILSQFCDWNTQTMINAFTKLVIDAGLAGEDFPLKAIHEIAIQKNRTGKLYESQFLSYPCLPLACDKGTNVTQEICFS